MGYAYHGEGESLVVIAALTIHEKTLKFRGCTGRCTVGFQGACLCPRRLWVSSLNARVPIRAACSSQVLLRGESKQVPWVSRVWVWLSAVLLDLTLALEQMAHRRTMQCHLNEETLGRLSDALRI